jgi:hypothetical protein
MNPISKFPHCLSLLFFIVFITGSQSSYSQNYNSKSVESIYTIETAYNCVVAFSYTTKILKDLEKTGSKKERAEVLADWNSSLVKHKLILKIFLNVDDSVFTKEVKDIETKFGSDAIKEAIGITNNCTELLLKLEATNSANTSAAVNTNDSLKNSSVSRLTIKGYSLGNNNKNSCTPIESEEYSRIVRKCVLTDGHDTLKFYYSFDSNEVVRIIRYQFLMKNFSDTFQILRDAIDFYGTPSKAPGKTSGEQHAIWNDGSDVALDIRARYCEDEKRNLAPGYGCATDYSEVIVYDLLNKTEYKKISDTGEKKYISKKKSNF